MKILNKLVDKYIMTPFFELIFGHDEQEKSYKTLDEVMDKINELKQNMEELKDDFQKIELQFANFIALYQENEHIKAENNVYFIENSIYRSWVGFINSIRYLKKDQDVEDIINYYNKYGEQATRDLFSREQMEKLVERSEAISDEGGTSYFDYMLKLINDMLPKVPKFGEDYFAIVRAYNATLEHLALDATNALQEAYLYELSAAKLMTKYPQVFGEQGPPLPIYEDLGNIDHSNIQDMTKKITEIFEKRLDNLVKIEKKYAINFDKLKNIPDFIPGTSKSLEEFHKYHPDTHEVGSYLKNCKITSYDGITLKADCKCSKELGDVMYGCTQKYLKYNDDNYYRSNTLKAIYLPNEKVPGYYFCATYIFLHKSNKNEDNNSQYSGHINSEAEYDIASDTTFGDLTCMQGVNGYGRHILYNFQGHDFAYFDEYKRNYEVEGHADDDNLTYPLHTSP